MNQLEVLIVGFLIVSWIGLYALCFRIENLEQEIKTLKEKTK